MSDKDDVNKDIGITADGSRVKVVSKGKIDPMKAVAILVLTNMALIGFLLVAYFYISDGQQVQVEFVKQDRIDEQLREEQSDARFTQIFDSINDTANTINSTANNINAKADRNFKQLANVSEQGAEQREAINNASLAVFLPLLLDTDEDIEQVKDALNISDLPKDLIHIDYNGTFITVTNDRFNGTIDIPEFNVTGAQITLDDAAATQNNNTR